MGDITKYKIKEDSKSVNAGKWVDILKIVPTSDGNLYLLKPNDPTSEYPWIEELLHERDIHFIDFIID